jgi:hypothetical protein
MTTAREETARLSEMLRREHQALGDFLIALAAFDREKRWVELGYASLFSFLTRELKLSNGAAQNRKTAAELVQKYPQVEAALREGRLCLSTVNEVAKVISTENVEELLPKFFGLSARDAAFLAVSIRPVENPPVRDFLVTSVRGNDTAAPPSPPGAGPQLHTSEVPLSKPTPSSAASGTDQAGPAPALDRPRIMPLDAERARVNMTVSRRLLGKLAAARDALSHSHPGASEETIIEVGLDLPLLPTPRHPHLRLPAAAATSLRASGARSGRAIRGAAPGRSRAVGSAAPPSEFSSTTSTAGRSGPIRPSRAAACSARSTRTSTPGRFTGTST